MPAKNDNAVCLTYLGASFAGKPRSNSGMRSSVGAELARDKVNAVLASSYKYAPSIPNRSFMHSSDPVSNSLQISGRFS